jgi:penicillin V acylase-like amidase (Ntn superfamily)
MRSPSIKRLSLCIQLSVLAGFVCGSVDAKACSAFSFSDGAKIFVAKNYDWIPFHGHGAVFINKRGVSKKAETLRTKNAAEWTSKYGSITFNQFGREFPVSGMNEAGLSAELLQMPETVYIDETDPRPALNESQWLQYQLDNYGSLKEAIGGMNTLRVEQAFIGAHYLICDRTGECGAFEYLNGKLVVATGEHLQPHVLTNNFYEESISTLKGKPVSEAFKTGAEIARSKMSAFFSLFANTTISVGRFLTAAKLLEKRAQAATPANDFAFDALGKVAVARILWTQWSLVYDLTDLEVTFKTRLNSSLKKLSLQGFDFSCASPVLTADIQQVEGGDIRSRLKPYDSRSNRALVDENWMVVSSRLRDLAATYPERNTHCVRP